MNNNMLLSTDAEYLLQYIKIAEGFLNSEYSLRDAETALVKLNAEFKDCISAKALKTFIPSGPVWMHDRDDYDSDAEFEDRDQEKADGWMPSMIC
jgi:hypothetical protein